MKRGARSPDRATVRGLGAVSSPPWASISPFGEVALGPPPSCHGGPSPAPSPEQRARDKDAVSQLSHAYPDRAAGQSTILRRPSAGLGQHDKAGGKLSLLAKTLCALATPSGKCRF